MSADFKARMLSAEEGALQEGSLGQVGNTEPNTKMGKE